MGIFQVPVEPSVLNLFFVNFSGGQISLGVFPVYHISVYVNIVEFVVLSDTLRLIIESVYRFIVVNTNIFNSFRVSCNILAGQRIVCIE